MLPPLPHSELKWQSLSVCLFSTFSHFLWTRPAKGQESWLDLITQLSLPHIQVYHKCYKNPSISEYYHLSVAVQISIFIPYIAQLPHCSQTPTPNTAPTPTFHSLSSVSSLMASTPSLNSLTLHSIISFIYFNIPTPIMFFTLFGPSVHWPLFRFISFSC